jgi:hypothetical protein
MWFLETIMTPELELKRNTFSLNEIKKQNQELQKNTDATNRTIRARKWKEDADKKILRGY